MKFNNILMTMLLAALLVVSCRTKEVAGPATFTPEQSELIDRVCSQPLGGFTHVAAKMKFTVTVNGKQHSLTGSLRMKRDDVIRLQLTALGLIEAARLEFTQDDVLIMDRINKQYIKVPYDSVSFLSSSGINFSMLQALFWNEVFVPGELAAGDSLKNHFATRSLGHDEALVSFADASDDKVRNKLSYSWRVDELTGDIKQADIEYRDKKQTTRLQWEYSNFKSVASSRFPHNMLVTLAAKKKKNLSLGIRLSDIGNNSNWDTRTRVSSKYNTVDIDYILKLITSL